MNIAYRLNMVLSAPTVSTHIRIHRLNYNEKENLSGLMAPVRASSMLLLQHRELEPRAAKQLDQDITDATDKQR